MNIQSTYVFFSQPRASVINYLSKIIFLWQICIRS